MRAITLLAIAALATSAARAEQATCFRQADLAPFYPSAARAFDVIDTARKGCVTGDQVAAWKAAMKEDRKEQRERIAARMQAAR